MELPNWQRIPGASNRYIDPSGNDVSRRSYLNAQAQAVGYANYSQFQREIKQPLYQQVVARSADPKAARRLDSPLNSDWAKNMKPKLDAGKPIGRDLWGEIFDDAGIDADDDIRERYG